MSKKWFAALAFAFVSVALFAYNPPAGGLNMYRYVSPSTLTSASVAGGAIQNVAPSTAVENPAFTAFEQRAILDVAGTIMVNNKDYGPLTEKSSGGAFQIGILIPTRLFAYTASVQGIFVPFPNMQVANTFSLYGSMAKDITDNFSVALGLRVGFLAGFGSDWTLAADIGAYYNAGDLGFMKNFRFGAVVKNLGKMFNHAEVIGRKLEWENKNGVFVLESADPFPAIATIKAGVATSFVDTKVFNLGLSLDASVPTVIRGFVLDLGLMMAINVKNACTIGIQSAWQFDLMETIKGEVFNLIPTIGLSARFLINADKSEFMKDKGWAQSEIAVHTAYANLYQDTNAFSFQGIINLGMKDTQEPIIYLWDEDYNDYTKNEKGDGNETSNN